MSALLQVLKRPTWIVTGAGLVGALLIAWGLVVALERPERAFEKQIWVVLGVIGVAPLFVFYRFGLLVLLFASLVGEPFPGEVRVTLLLGVVIAARRFLDVMVLGKPLHGAANAMVLCAGLFVGALVVSLVNVPDLYAGAIGLASYIQVLLMVLLVIDFVRGTRELRWLMLVFVLAGFVNAGIAAYGLHEGGDDVRAEGASGNANRFGMQQLILLSLVLPLIGYLRSLTLRMVLLVWVGVMLFSIVLSASRGTFVAAVAALGVFFLLGKQRLTIRMKIPVAAALLGLAVALPWLPSEQFVERITSIPTSQDEAESKQAGTRTRLLYAESGIRMALDHPWTGVGLNQFTPSLQIYAPRKDFKAKGAHNMYISVLAEAGFPGLVTFLGVLTSALLAARARVGGLGPTLGRGFSGAVQVAMVAFLIGGVFGTLQVSKIGWTVMALAVSLQVMSRRPSGQMTP